MFGLPDLGVGRQKLAHLELRGWLQRVDLGRIDAVEALLEFGKLSGEGNPVGAALFEFALGGGALDITKPRAVALDIERTLGLGDFVLRLLFEVERHSSTRALVFLPLRHWG